MTRLKKVLWLFCWLSTLTALWAQSEAPRDAIQKYLLASGKNAEERSFYLPYLKDVLVLKLDVDGHGKQDVFISSTGFGDRSGHIWFVYEADGAAYRQLTGETGYVQFRLDAFYIGQVPELNFSGLLAYFPGPQNTGHLYGYNFSEEKIEGKPLKDVDLSNEADAELVYKYLQHDEVKPDRFKREDLLKENYHFPGTS
jgi:hypothetical protein